MNPQTDRAGRPQAQGPSRFLSLAGAWLIAAAMTGCATAPPPAPAPVPAPPQPTLAELMQDAQSAVQAGTKERARQSLRNAAKAYPTAKEPWVKLAADYFEALDYGNAILAAQEVTQRDPLDGTAHSILAVSGLRVSSSALATLRAQQSGMPNDTRTEAQVLTRVLRETLGEQVLVPRADAPVAAPTPRRTNRSGSAAPAPASKPAPVTATAAPVPAGATPTPAKPATAVAATAVTAPATPTPATPTAAKPVAPVVAKPSPTPAAKPAANPFDILR